MKYFIIILLTAFSVLSCKTMVKVTLPVAQPERLTGAAFYKQAAAMNWQQRDSLALKEMLAGNMPSFLLHFVPVELKSFDSLSGKWIKALAYVSPDYVSIGTTEDWARIPLTPMAAQQLADSLHCFLPTKKLVDEIYAAAVIKPEPVPLFAFRDSSPVFYQHHLIIEGQRKGKTGLIAGIKKDVVISGRLLENNKTNRVAIYGWHKPDGKPIQPLYTGHVNWYVDYSHGIRLVYQWLRVGKKWLHYTTILNHTVLHKLLCIEELCSFYKY